MVVAGSCLVGYVTGGLLDNGYIGLGIGAALLVIVLALLYFKNRNTPVLIAADGAPVTDVTADENVDNAVAEDTPNTEKITVEETITETVTENADETVTETVEETVTEEVEETKENGEL